MAAKPHYTAQTEDYTASLGCNAWQYILCPEFKQVGKGVYL